MQGTFAYLLALAVWGFVTCIVWSAAILMCVMPQTRPFAWPTALGAAVTFPFVFAYQMLVAPIILAMLSGGVALRKILEPDARGVTEHPVVIGTFLAVVGVSFLMAAVASVAGFVDGWRTGWGLARGRSLKAMLSETIVMRYIGRVRARRR